MFGCKHDMWRHGGTSDELTAGLSLQVGTHVVQYVCADYISAAQLAARLWLTRVSSSLPVKQNLPRVGDPVRSSATAMTTLGITQG